MRCTRAHMLHAGRYMLPSLLGNTWSDLCAAIDPSAGKKSTPPPFDPKARKDLFQVLNQASPAPASSDSWVREPVIVSMVDACRPQQLRALPAFVSVLTSSSYHESLFSGAATSQAAAFSATFSSSVHCSIPAACSHRDDNWCALLVCLQSAYCTDHPPEHCN